MNINENEEELVEDIDQIDDRPTHTYYNSVELNENKHTIRQIKLYEKLGEDYKANLKKEVIKFNVYFWLLQVLIAAVAVTCFLNNSILLAVVCAGIVVFDIVSIYRKRLKQFDDIQVNEDYRVGIYASYRDPRVIGSTDRKVSTIRRATSLIGALGMIFGVMMLVQGLRVKPIEKTAVKEESVQLFQSIYHGSNDADKKDEIKNFQSVGAYVVPVVSETSDFVYVIIPSLDASFDIDAYKLAVDGKTEDEIKAQSVKLNVYNTNSSTATKGYYYVLGLEIDGVSYLDVDESLNVINTAQAKTAKTNTIVGGVVAGIGLLTFSSSYLFKLIFYKGLKAKEEIDLGYTKEEQLGIDEQNKIAQESRMKLLEQKRAEREAQAETFNNSALDNANILCKKKVTSLVTSLIVLIGGIGFVVFGSFFVKSTDNSMKLLAICVGAAMVLFGGYSLFDFITYRITLDKNELVYKKLTKETRYNIYEIGKIDYQQGSYILSDYEDKPVAYINASLENSHELIKNLHDRGIETTFKMN